MPDRVVRELKLRAAANGRSAEAEHREILRRALPGDPQDFAARAARLRERLASTVDSTDIIRADRDRDFRGDAHLGRRPNRQLRGSRVTRSVVSVPSNLPRMRKRNVHILPNCLSTESSLAFIVWNCAFCFAAVV